MTHYRQAGGPVPLGLMTVERFELWKSEGAANVNGDGLAVPEEDVEMRKWGEPPPLHLIP